MCCSIRWLRVCRHCRNLIEIVVEPETVCEDLIKTNHCKNKQVFEAPYERMVTCRTCASSAQAWCHGAIQTNLHDEPEPEPEEHEETRHDSIDSLEAQASQHHGIYFLPGLPGQLLDTPEEIYRRSMVYYELDTTSRPDASWLDQEEYTTYQDAARNIRFSPVIQVETKRSRSRGFFASLCDCLRIFGL